jgi:hypothetical protein
MFDGLDMHSLRDRYYRSRTSKEAKMTRDGMLNKDLHVYLDERDHRALKEWAAAECRSVSGQAMHIIRQALAERPVGMASFDANAVRERIRHGTGALLQGNKAHRKPLRVRDPQISR